MKTRIKLIVSAKTQISPKELDHILETDRVDAAAGVAQITDIVARSWNGVRETALIRTHSREFFELRQISPGAETRELVSSESAARIYATLEIKNQAL